MLGARQPGRLGVRTWLVLLLADMCGHKHGGHVDNMSLHQRPYILHSSRHCGINDRPLKKSLLADPAYADGIWDSAFSGDQSLFEQKASSIGQVQIVWDGLKVAV